MDRRLLLHETLCDILLSLGVWALEPSNPQAEGAQSAIDKHVYFDPPEGFRMSYPCIVYRRSRIESQYANNRAYRTTKKYEITVIDKDPDSVIPDKIAMLPQCRHDRNFVNDSLHHDVFTLEF